MTPLKTIILILYFIAILVAIYFPLTLWSQFCLGSLAFISVCHSGVTWYYRELTERAPGTRWGNLLFLFLFGLFHMVDMKNALRDFHPGMLPNE